jgi:Asp-tRNA(Asn)/Glu-tRNA(Gln) amidotransferase A subunit family amidase
MERTAAATELGSAGLPVAAQLVARPWRDEEALAAMRVVEAHTRALGTRFDVA